MIDRWHPQIENLILGMRGVIDELSPEERKRPLKSIRAINTDMVGPPGSVTPRPNGFAISHVYYETEPGRRTAANLMSKDQARQISRVDVRVPDCNVAGCAGIDYE